ncbi:MAG: pyridoxal phosphate-dependent aminotransferase [Spirochaetia bacterium]|nr:pyridoxal phosphate-dependent aminotransferase [Spirochaetia bacterium]
MEKKYNFDTVINRWGTSSVKYLDGTDLLPLWVADMDFPLPEEVLSVIKKRVDHGIFGYTLTGASYWKALDSWCATEYGYHVKPSEWVTVPGIVYGLSIAIRAVTEPSDAVLIEQPVYYPFSQVVNDNNRKLIVAPLCYKDGRYTRDIGAFEKAIRENNVKAFILCSPHNPVGRVWTKEELLAVAEICRRYDVTVIADEIHCDFIRAGIKFTSFATLGDEYKQKLILCTAPSKTFNLAGLQVSNIWVPDTEIRKKFKKENRANGYNEVNALGMTAAEAVYTLGKPWLTQLKAYLEGNIAYVKDFLAKNLPSVYLVESEGTYLLWLDFHGTGLSNQDIKDRIENKAKLWLDHGDMFGEGGDYFERINIACPRSILEQAMNRLKGAFK